MAIVDVIQIFTIFSIFFLKFVIRIQKHTREGIDGSQRDELIEEAKRVIANLDFSNKIKVIRDIIDRCIVKGGNTVDVWGHLNFSTVNMGYELICWDCGPAKCWQEHLV